MDGGCDIVRVDIDVSVRPMQGVWECCDPPRIEKQKKGGTVILKGSQSVMFCKELPSTSKATSGPYKDFDYNISSTTTSSRAPSLSTEVSSSWKKGAPTKLKDKSIHRTKKIRQIEDQSGRGGEPKRSSVDFSKESKRKDDSKKNSERGVVSKRKVLEKKPLSKRGEEQPVKKEEPKPRVAAVEEDGGFNELEYWMVLALFWFFLLTVRYFILVQMEIL